ncbi:MAG: hypothetical protein AB1297_04605 [bacterium]
MREAVDNTFKILELMEELRDIFRKTAPLHELSKEQLERVKMIISEAREALTILEELLCYPEGVKSTI